MATTIKPIIIEPSTEHTATIIFLHGLGDTGHGWAEEIEVLKPPHAKLICPTAPTAPVTINDGFRMPSWFDIRSLEKFTNDQDEDGVKQSSKAISDLIQSEINGVDGKPGIPASRIILGGFSQGGALALYTGLTGPFKLASIISLSGYLPISYTISWESINKPKILQCHGDSDTVVALEFGVMTSEILKEHVPELTFKVYKGMDHGVCEEEISDLRNFLKDTIPPI